MEIKMERNGNELTVILEGRLNTLTASQLEPQLEEALDGVESLIFDFSKLEYISSAGLRVMLTALQIMEEQDGTTVVKNPTNAVLEVFEITGFIDELTIV